VKRIGDVLSSIFDEQTIKKAQGYSKLFDSWVDITEKNGIAAAADHSRIKELERGILFVEADHPGWKQILQTKQSQLLNDFRRRFPGMDISGIALMLSRGHQTEEKPKEEPGTETNETPPARASENSAAPGYDTIKDESFKETLKRLEQKIADREVVK
jgi:hypothetical protein